jgi:hypothetical protein
MRDAVSKKRFARMNRTHCPHGHPYSGDNLIFNSRSGARACRSCRTRCQAAYAAKVKATAKVAETSNA